MKTFTYINKNIISFNLLLLICFVFSGLLSTAQTNTGKDFWLAEPPNLGNRGDYAISIVNSSTAIANITITNPINATVNAAIPPGELETFTFGTQSTSIQNTGTYSNNVYHVTSDETIVIYTFTPIQSNFSNDASLILPTTALGKRYRSASYVSPLNNHGSVTGVIATENNTNIQLFNPSGTLVDNVTINQGEYFQRNNGFGVSNDMTGWLVLADKNVASMGGSICTAIGTARDACDHLHEQLIPEESIASELIACPTRSRPIGCTTNCSPDIFRYVATVDNTTISTFPNVGGGTINAGEFIEVSTSTPHTVTATEPIYGYQYLISQTSGSPQPNTGDPALLNMPPVDQFLFDYTFLIPDSFPNNFINVVAPSGTNFILDGSPISPTCTDVGTIAGTTYCCFALPVLAGVHNISGSQQFGISISGFDNFASYAYTGGLGLQPLNAGCNTGGPYSQEACDISAFQLDGTATCSDNSTPNSVLWSSSNPGVSFSDATIEDPLAILPDYGTFEVTFTVNCTDLNGNIETTSCTSTITATVPDPALPTVTFTAPDDQEVNSGILSGLGSGTPIGGMYSGQGVTDDGNGETYSFDTAFLDGGLVTITYTYTDENGCTASASDDVEAISEGPCEILPEVIWEGDIDSDWTNAGNWENDNAPGLSAVTDVTIPTGMPNYPVLIVGQDLYISECSHVTIDSGASMMVNPNVVVSNDGTLTNNGTTTFESDATGSAYIGSGTGTFLGDFTVERYIPAKRAYRQLATPVATSTPISENWQQDTHITGPAGNTDGFDVTNTGNPSMYIFDNVGLSYVQMANTNATNLIPETMYHTLIRGDRNTDLTNNNATPSITTLRATGELTPENAGTSTLTINVPSQQFIAVGNPFQAPVNMNTLLTTGTSNIASIYYWVWDPTLNYRGAYTSVMVSNGNASSGDSDANQFLQAGQAGWVNTMGAGASSISFTQASKATSESETLVFKSSSKKASVGQLRLSLYENSALSANESAADGLLILFDTEGNNAVDAYDAAKFINLDENFATNNNGKFLSIENRAEPKNAEEIQLEINTYRKTNYTIVAEGTSIQGPTAYLFDSFTNVSTEIPQNGKVNYTYSINSSIPDSVAGDRFKIIFESIALSTADSNIVQQIKMYPNPSNIGKFYLNIPIGLDDLEVTIYNTLGAKLYYNTGFKSGNKVSINTDFILSQGIYFVKLSSQGKTTTKKLNIN